MIILIFNHLTGRLNPRYAPTKTKGVATQNQRASNAKNVVNGIAAELPFAQRTIFRTKNIPKMALKIKTQ
jgi:peroxiredoxin